MDRRDMLRGGLLAGTAAVMAAPAASATAKPGPPGALRRLTTAFDVAYIGRMERYAPVLPFPGVTDATEGAVNAPGQFEDAENGTFRAWFIYREGYIYSAGTIPEGPGWDPESAKPLGTIFSWGNFIEAVRKREDPQAVNTHVYVLGEITPERLFPPDQLTSTGLEFVHEDETKSERERQPGVRSVYELKP